MTLEEKFYDKKIIVESQVYGGQDDDKTQIYMGTYKGTDSLGGRDVLLLENASFYVLNTLRGLDNDRKTPFAAIPWNNVMSVSIYDNEGEN